MRYFYSFLLLLLINLLSPPAIAQHYLFDAQLLTTDDGLSNLMVTAIYKDRKGFIWAATPYGLDRYDGYTFRHFSIQKDRPLRHRPIKEIKEDDEGNLWLFYSNSNIISANPTDHFLYTIDIFNTETEKIVSLPVYFGEELPFKLKEVSLPRISDLKNRIWIMTRKGAVFLYEKHTFKKIYEDKGQFFKYLTIDAQDHIWLGADTEITCINKKGDLKEQFQLTHPILGIWSGEDGRMWFAHRKLENNLSEIEVWYKDKTINHLEAFHFFGPEGPMKLLSNSTHHIHRDQNGHWFTNIDDRSHLFANKGERLLSFDDYFDKSTFNLVENENQLWWGSPSGIVKISRKKNPFQLIHRKQGRTSDCRGMAEDDEGNIYFINSFIYKWNPKSRQIRQMTVADISAAYALIYTDSLLWTSSYHSRNQGYQYDLKTGAIQEYLASNAREVYYVLESNIPNRYLAGTDKGLSYIDLNRQTALPFDKYKSGSRKDSILKKSTIYHLHPNQSGIWLATNNGIFLVNENQGILAYFDDLPFNHIRHIHEDAEGMFWLATSGGGIIKWQPPTRAGSSSKSWQFTTQDGLSNNHTYAIYEDDYDRLWIPSDKGLMCMDRLGNRIIKTYLKEDGLSHNEFNLTSHYQTKDGTLYFGGLGGLISFHPSSVTRALTTQTPLEFTRYHLLEKGNEKMTDKTDWLKNRDRIIIKPSDRLFELKFALLDFDLPKHHRYLYQIQGYADFWQVLENNYLRISHLPYGRYRINIKGQNVNQGWSEKELSLPIKVLKPFYLQRWFIAILMLGATGAIIAFTKWREQNFKREQERLEAEVQKRTLTIQQQVEELKVLDKAKTRFFSNITHEFRTPLTLIIGPIEQLLNENLPKFVHWRLSGIVKNAQQLLNLINQLLDLSKLEGGQMKIETAHSDIVNDTLELIQLFQPLADLKGQRLTFVSSQDKWETYFDRRKWDKIIYNLTGNAIKFTPNGGAIQLSLSKIIKQDKEWIFLSVKDAGSGIEKAYLSQVFNRFFQADTSSTRMQGGTGIGLSLVKELVDLQGGEIWVLSEMNKGTTFRVCLPILQTERTQVRISEPVPAVLPLPIMLEKAFTPTVETPVLDSTEKLELLIVEDNDEMREYIRYCINDSKFNISEAGDGEEGFQKALALIPDLIISDVMMPKKNGFALTQAIRGNTATSHIPLILLTAKASLESRLEGLKRGADAYLVKPFSPQELVLRIQKLIEIRRILRQRYQNGLQAVNNDVYQQEDEFIANLREYILQNIKNPKLNSDHICRHFAISRSALFRKLKALTNRSISDFVRSIRLEVAFQLIQEDRLILSEIAYNTGFSSPSHFSRTFKKVYGKTPSEIK